MQKCKVSDIFKGLDLTPGQWAKVESEFQELSVKKGEILLTAGQAVPHQYYVASGCLRTYFISEAG